MLTQEPHVDLFTLAVRAELKSQNQYLYVVMKYLFSPLSLARRGHERWKFSFASVFCSLFVSFVQRYFTFCNDYGSKANHLYKNCSPTTPPRANTPPPTLFNAAHNEQKARQLATRSLLAEMTQPKYTTKQ